MRLLFALLLAASPSSTVRLRDSGSARVGEKAPAFGGWDLEGVRVLTLEGLRRTPYLAPVLLAFGASWCKGCGETLQRLQAVEARHPEVRLVLIDVDAEAQRARAFAGGVRFAGPALLDKLEQIARLYGVGGEQKALLPRTFLVDADGIVRAIYGETGDDLEKAIEADVARARY